MVHPNDLFNRLKGVVKSHKELVDKGFNRDILEIYLVSKTKLSRKDVKKMLDNLEYFYEHMIADFVAEEI